MLRLLVIAWLVFAGGSAVAQPKELSDEARERFEELRQQVLEEAESSQPAIDKFQLYTGCQSVDYMVEVKGSSIELSLADVYPMVHNRLSASRIPEGDGRTYIYVRATIVGAAFSVEVEFNKPVYDPITDAERNATTWTSSVLGTHGNDRDYVLLQIYQQIDHFIAEYLRVNECE